MRYEDLTQNPEQKVREFCEFLKLDFESQMLNITTSNSAEDNSSSKESKGIVATSVGRWRKTLDPAEIAVCQWRASKDIEDLGYSFASVSLIDKLKVPKIFLHSLVEFSQRLFRRFRLGGWNYFQNILGSYWKKFQFLIFRS